MLEIPCYAHILIGIWETSTHPQASRTGLHVERGPDHPRILEYRGRPRRGVLGERLARKDPRAWREVQGIQAASTGPFPTGDRALKAELVVGRGLFLGLAAPAAEVSIPNFPVALASLVA